MDYSVFYPSIIIGYIGGFAGTILVIILLICGEVFLIKQYLKSKSTIELIGIFVFVVLIIVVSYYSKIYFKDIPNVINKNYIVSRGTVIEGNNGGQDPETRGFVLKTDDGEIKRLCVVYLPIDNGDRFEVIYLPNTEWGAIIQKLKGDELS